MCATMIALDTMCCNESIIGRLFIFSMFQQMQKLVVLRSCGGGLFVSVGLIAFRTKTFKTGVVPLQENPPDIGLFDFCHLVPVVDPRHRSVFVHD